VGSLHGSGYSGGSALSGSFTIPSLAYFDDFHTYTIEWGPNVVYWYVDDELYSVKSPLDLPGGAPWAFNDHPFFILLNMAVGGNWPGSPNSSTIFPKQTLVDYVRVYEADGDLTADGLDSAPQPVRVRGGSRFFCRARGQRHTGRFSMGVQRTGSSRRNPSNAGVGLRGP
jgi:beta-glucanase (GH16 family)